MDIKNIIRQATEKYYKSFIAHDLKTWRGLVDDACVFSGSIADFMTADERYERMKVSTNNPQNLTYEIIGVSAECRCCDVMTTFDYSSDGHQVTLSYLAHMDWLIADDGTPKLMRHILVESVDNLREAQLAREFNKLYFKNRTPQPTSGQIIIIGTIERIVERDSINLYVLDDNKVEWWCRAEEVEVSEGQRVRVTGVMGKRNRGWCVEVSRIEPSN